MPAPYQRSQRVSELIRKELGELILREVEFDNALATIIDVEVTPKLDYARVFVSVIPSDKAQDVLRTLNHARPGLQRLLLRKINIKPMPELSFVIDHGQEKAAAVEKALLDEEAKNR